MSNQVTQKAARNLAIAYHAFLETSAIASGFFTSMTEIKPGDFAAARAAWARLLNKAQIETGITLYEFTPLDRKTFNLAA